MMSSFGLRQPGKGITLHGIQAGRSNQKFCGAVQSGVPL